MVISPFNSNAMVKLQINSFITCLILLFYCQGESAASNNTVKQSQKSAVTAEQTSSTVSSSTTKDTTATPAKTTKTTAVAALNTVNTGGGGAVPQNIAAGQVSVEPFVGSASLSLPIQVPPGRGGIQPNVALTYSSSFKQLGFAGVGWTLNFGSIQISTQKGKPKYDGTDLYVLMQNGSSQNLVFDSSAGFYRQEIEGSFAKIVKDANGWVLTDKKGVSYYFGYTDDAKQYDAGNSSHIFQWALNKVRDINGNYLTISYMKDQGQIYPQTVNYTGNDVSSPTLSPYAQVTINYGSSSVYSVSYISGFVVKTAKRVNSISTSVNGSQQALYSFSYAQNTNTGRDVLQSIVQTGADGTSALPPVTFTYANTQPDFGPVTSISSNNPPYNAGDSVIFMMDMNGDGYMDILQTYTGNNQIYKIYFNDKNGGFLPPVDAVNSPIRGTDNPDLKFFDFNGDGLMDVILGQTAPYQIWINNGQNGYYAPITVSNCPNHSITYQNLLQFADMNGDGYLDLVETYSGNNQNYKIYYNNKSNDFLAPVNAVNSPIRGADNPDIHFLDFNGDGLLDVIYGETCPYQIWINNGQNGYYSPTTVSQCLGFSITYQNLTQFVDMNGDGLLDMVKTYAGINQTYYVYYNNGKGDFDSPVPLVNSPIRGSDNANVKFADLNNDGLVDVLYGENNVGWYAWINNGKDGFGPTITITNHHATASLDDWNVFLFDMDGNATPEVFLGSLGEPPYKMWKNLSKDDGLLVKINNGVGATTDIAYSYTVVKGLQSSVYKKAISSYLLPTVKSVTVSVNGSSYVTNYEYSNGLWDSGLREFDGFGSVKVIDAQGNYTQTTYLQDHYMKGHPSVVSTYDSNGNLFTRVVNQWQTQNIFTNTSTNQTSKFPFLLRTDKYLYDGSSSAKRTAQAFTYAENPQYGDITQVINYGEVDSVTGNDTGTDTVTTNNEYVNNTAIWLIGLPNHIYVQDINSTTIGQTWLYYDGSTDNNATPSLGRLTKKVNWLGSSTQADPSMSYSYDTYGNLQSTIDPLGRTTTVTYDNDVHMFPIQTSNALNQTTTTSYYGVAGVPLSSGGLQGLWGQTKSVTDTNNQTSYNAYDTFGRTIISVSPLDTVSLPTMQKSYTQASNYTQITTQARVESGNNQTIPTVEYYDGLGRLIETKTLAPNPGQYIISGQTEYDYRGLPVKQYTSNFTTNDLNTLDTINTTLPNIQKQYDAMGRTIKNINTDGTYSTIVYDHWTTTTVDENGHMQKAYVDALGRLVKREEYKGADGRWADYPQTAYTLFATTQYGYDLLGNLTTVTDAKNNITTISYDHLNRKIAMNDPDMGAWSYSYDANGNLISQTDAKGQVVRFSYDALNRLLNKTDGIPSGPINNFPNLPPITPSFNILYTYDVTNQTYGLGRLGSVAYDNGMAGFSYDQLGRETSSTKQIDGVNYSVSRQYDALNRLTQLQYPDGAQLKYLYNQAGQVTAVADAAAVVNGMLVATVPEGVKNQKQASSIEELLGIENAYAADPPTNYCSVANSRGGWRFNETSGTVYDCTANGNNGVNTGWTQGVAGHFTTPAIKGTNINNSNVNLGSPSSLDNLTLISVAVWVKVDSYVNGAYQCSGPAILAKGYRSGVLCLQSNGAVRWVEHNSNGTGLYDTSGTVGLGAWHHIAVTFNRTTGSNFNAGPTIYIDGVAQTVTNHGTAPAGSARDDDNTLSWYVGKDNQDVGEFNGSVDDLLIYNGILSSTEVSNIMNNGIDGSAGTGNTPPTVSISSPANNATFTAPASITINATAADNDGTITKVDFYNGSTLLGTDTTSPYSFTVTNVPPGTYSVTAQATDNNGAVTTSAAVNVTVSASNVPPTVSISSPANNATFTAPASITINATAADSDGTITKVDFYNGSTLLGTDTTSPYSYTWSSVAAGSYALTAQATDNNGAVTTSAAVNVTVSASNVPPTVSISSPANNATFTAPANIALLASAAATNGTITKVEFYNGSTLLGTSTSSPYSYNWTNVPVGNYSLTAKAYDSNNNTTVSTAVNAQVSASINEYIKRIDYNARGQITQIQYGNGTVTAYTYDSVNFRLNRIYTSNAQAQKVQDLNYTYDAIGQIKSITDTVNTSSQTFRYDELNRLIQAQGSYGTKTYVYDEIGNIIQKDGLTYSYAELNSRTDGNKAGPHAVTSLSDGTTFKYDLNGNMATMIKGAETTMYIYDVQNRLTSVSSQTSGQSPVTIAEYSYDGDGGRTKKIVYRRDKAIYNVTTTWGQALFGNMNSTPLPATQSNPTVDVTRYVGNIYEEENPGTEGSIRHTRFVYIGGTRVAAVNYDGSIFYYHNDYLGGTNALTDQAGLVRDLTEYDPFGLVTRHERYGNDFATIWYGFTGKPLDDETGLMYYGARYYNPKLGRFITPDTVVQSPGKPQTLNRYTYCNNNPVNLIDPSGHKWSWQKFWHAAVGAIIGVAASFLLGPAGFAIVGYTMAGIIGGSLGGAVSGGLDGGGRGALIGGALGGALGGIGGWAYGASQGLVPGVNSSVGNSVLGGMAAGGIGYTAATGSWDSFAGGLAGSIGGGLLGKGIVGTVRSYQQPPSQTNGASFYAGSESVKRSFNINVRMVNENALTIPEKIVLLEQVTVDTMKAAAKSLSDMEGFSPNEIARFKMVGYGAVGIQGLGELYSITKLYAMVQNGVISSDKFSQALAVHAIGVAVKMGAAGLGEVVGAATTKSVGGAFLVGAGTGAAASIGWDAFEDSYVHSLQR